MLIDIFISIGIGLASLMVGSVINWAIYSWSYFKTTAISPWSKQPSEASPRQWLDFIPVIGWWNLRRDWKLYPIENEDQARSKEQRYWRSFWIRPMLIELACCIFFAWFYWWMIDGSLIGHDKVAQLASHNQCLLWYCIFSFVIVLMVIATFIDFDEKMIPDLVTMPGTIIGLILASCLPSIRLPVIFEKRGEPTSIGWLDFASPNQPGSWYSEFFGLGLGIGIFLIWCFAIAPKITYWRRGMFFGIKIAVASMIRPRRKTKVAVEQKPRKMFIETWIVIALAIAGPIGIFTTWFVGGDPWLSLCSALVGMGLAGGMVWIIRIAATQAIGQEAMGFGDVTLMAMIGVFYGWQPSLLIFGFAPFASVLIALTQYLVSGRKDIAFGPYLCASAIVVLMGWSYFWNDWAGPMIFVLGPLLWVVMGISLVLMVVMLLIMRMLRGPAEPEDE